MPIQLICDRCGKKTARDYIHDKGVISYDGWRVQVTVLLHLPEGHPVLCEVCLFEILMKGERTPVMRGE